MSINSRTKGHTFERKVASELRSMFDGEKWVSAYSSAKKVDKVRLLKSSKVRRGEQSHGALEADVIVSGVPIWFELQHANNITPVKKLEQAERDIEHKGEEGSWIPVSICKETSSRSVQVTMRTWAFMRLMAMNAKDPATGNVPVKVDYKDFLRLIEGYSGI